ncbi:hypothetical protein OF83DRAFT_1059772 [Amylostereum chailletii]|nr:hypothetical protein OF83DRAFT_1059772 [Amylostereum chailletii]
MATTIPPPPHYYDTHADDDSPAPYLPPYSPDALDSERVLPDDHSSPSLLTQPLRIINAEQLWSGSHSFVYESAMMQISMGTRFWGLDTPAYGAHGLVEGTLRLGKKCTHTYKVTATLLGKGRITATSRGVITDVCDRLLVSDTIPLSPGPCEDEFYPTESPFSFCIPFPPSAPDGKDPLPPSFAAWLPGILCEIEYVLKIDMYRKGMRRHEGRIIPLQYLPKSWPPHAPFRQNIMHLSSSGRAQLRIVRLLETRPADGSRTSTSDPSATSVLASFPAANHVSSGHHVSFKITVRSPSSPALAHLYAQGVDVTLFKQMRVYVDNGRRVIGGRKVTLGQGLVVETDVSHEGYATLRCDVTVGEPGAEQSWGVDGLMEIAHYIHVSVRIPEGTGIVAPSYLHDERVFIATEPWGTRERELLQLGGMSAPALGMKGLVTDQPCRKNRMSMTW